MSGNVGQRKDVLVFTRILDGARRNKHRVYIESGWGPQKQTSCLHRKWTGPAETNIVFT